MGICFKAFTGGFPHFFVSKQINSQQTSDWSATFIIVVWVLVVDNHLVNKLQPESIIEF